MGSPKFPKQHLRADVDRECCASLKRAFEAYSSGFEAEWSDSYPGINAVTVMDLEDKPNPVLSDILLVLRDASLMRVKSDGDNWNHANLLEFAVLAHQCQ